MSNASGNPIEVNSGSFCGKWHDFLKVSGCLELIFLDWLS